MAEAAGVGHAPLEQISFKGALDALRQYSATLARAHSAALRAQLWRESLEEQLATPVGFAMVAANGNIYYGFWYPVVVAAATFVIGLFFLPETFRRGIDD